MVTGDHGLHGVCVHCLAVVAPNLVKEAAIHLRHQVAVDSVPVLTYRLTIAIEMNVLVFIIGSVTSSVINMFFSLWLTSVVCCSVIC